MGKHDSDEGLGFFLGGAETIKNIDEEPEYNNPKILKLKKNIYKCL